MNRPIKFRVWDTKDLKWLDNAFVRARDGDIQLYEYDSWEKAWTTCPYVKERLIAEQFTGLKDRDGREIYEGDILSWTIASTPIPHSTYDNRVPQRDDYIGTVTWGIVEDDEYGNDVLGWTLDGTRLHTEEGRANLRAPFEAHSLYAMVSRHAKDCSYPDSSWQMSFTAFKIIGNLHGHPTILNV